MNTYYEKLGIGKRKVSSNMEVVIKEVAKWNAEERMAAKVSLKEDITDAEAYNSIFVAFTLVSSLLTAIMTYLTVTEMFEKEIISEVGVCISFALLVLVIMLWMSGRDNVHRYMGLLTLLEEVGKEQAGALSAQGNEVTINNELNESEDAEDGE